MGQKQNLINYCICMQIVKKEQTILTMFCTLHTFKIFVPHSYLRSHVQYTEYSTVFPLQKAEAKKPSSHPPPPKMVEDKMADPFSSDQNPASYFGLDTIKI